MSAGEKGVGGEDDVEAKDEGEDSSGSDLDDGGALMEALAVVDPPPVYETAAYAQAPKLEVIAEHEILETEWVSPPTEEPSEVGPAPPIFLVGTEATSSYSISDFDRAPSPLDLPGLDLRAPHLSEPVLPKNYTEPSGLSNVFRTVGSFTRRLFHSPAMTPSDSASSLDWGSGLAVPTSVHGYGNNRFFRRGQLSSRNSVTSETSSLHIPPPIPRRSHRRPPNPELSRNRRPSGGFFQVKGTSAVSLRATEPFEGLPSPCGECPHCRRFFKGVTGFSFKALGRACPCRICVILEENSRGAPTPLGKQLANRGKVPAAAAVPLTSDFGMFCDACNQSGYISPDGRCSRLNSMQGSTLSGLPGVHAQPVVVVGSVVDPSSVNTSLDSLFPPRTYSIRDQSCQVGVSRQISMTSVETSGPLCRICHGSADKEESLISPCRCSGTLKYVHMSCLVHWLEISCRKLRKPPQCELCGYKYQRHKILNLRNCSWPKCSTRDKCLHLVFILSVMTMIACAAITIVCFKADQGVKSAPSPGQSVQLSAREIVTLVCGVLFFCAFFVAMYVEVKAQMTIYKLAVRFWLINHEWFVDEYRPDKDPEWQRRRKLRQQALRVKDEEMARLGQEEQEEEPESRPESPCPPPESRKVSAVVSTERIQQV